MLYNAISKVVPIGKKEAEEMLLKIGIDPKVRPEKLSLNEFARIFDMLNGCGKKGTGYFFRTHMDGVNEVKTKNNENYTRSSQSYCKTLSNQTE